MRTLKVAALSAIALLFYTWVDILIWQRVFEANKLWEYADSYHFSWLVILMGFYVVGIIALLPNIRDCVLYMASLFLGAHSGLEDILYYVMDGRTMPDKLPWLGGDPLIFHTSSTGVITSALVWMSILVFAYWYMQRSEKVTFVMPKR